MIKFTYTPHAADLRFDPVGFIPMMLAEEDTRSARDQLHEGYRHGGGWMPIAGFSFDSETGTLSYPEDPDLHPLAFAKLRDETILVYPHAWVVISQPDGSFEVSRMD